MVDDEVKYKFKEKAFKENNQQWPPSKHYIYITHKKIDAKDDNVDEDWAERNIFNSVIKM